MTVLQNFIVFEGLDGSGTSTQITLLKEKPELQNAVFTAEPTDSAVGQTLRLMLKNSVQLHPDTAAYLFAADRCEHVFGEHGIAEQTHSGRLVISDRYLFSSLAYQSVSCGQKLPEVLNAHFPLPQYVFFFELPPETALERVQSRGSKREIYETIDYQQKTAAEYRRIIGKYVSECAEAEKRGETAPSIIVIDASLPAKTVNEKIWEIIKKLPIIQA